MSLTSLTTDELSAFKTQQEAAYAMLGSAGLTLDITRGKPSPEQLDLASGLLHLPGDDYRAADGTDTRNYGGLQGLPELRAIFADLLGIPVDQLLAADNASLALMHDTLAFALLHGTPESPTPWAGQDIAFLCPSPGYDRHFALAEHLGFRLIPIDLHEDGPDVAQVRQHAADPAVKGLWIVPTYANPTGAVVSEAVAAELAGLETGAPDFRLYWDNAYAVHHLTPERVKTPDILGLASAAGHPNRPLVFASTSKITFAGSGVSFLGGSPENIAWYLQHVQVRTIGPDKVNQLRHARLLRDADGVLALMDQHREILAPKFAVVERVLHERLAEHDVATWTQPRGGYFVSLDVVDGTATRVVQLAKDIGLALTPAGSSFPYKSDPRDRNIRIAPSFPSLADLEAAMEALATCVLLAAAEKALTP
ncbi:MAG: aminotransferase class I/II-fold pyridoxal phosphate-dependent enzyme [Aeromicrobium sp.]|uniref:aminotransferase class I/II-fold pyridoxal phosphate-dependent enzyme n=1 Tax=Aeromicrobium sp. TaxID=1871063 RepID=UPI0025C47617|nr:aminotransferase class I/II-fold pyridoxal phosphate-dependent enzyme [Aeromicrobium sp.]MCK5890557.1 aminotransferase class I/II-fold pyridoxal phosphate-dependent enzyme [Aeromicrobium sp.]MDF1703474.1 aminotransferase class I/II-fold pyridoxal phosphate-dependent enzyme [Aeromicrobium sp.]